MLNAINRNSGLFEPNIADELNNAFKQTDEKIEAFSPTPLEPKYSMSALKVNPLTKMSYINQSFVLDNHIYTLNINFKLDDAITDTDIFSINLNDCLINILTEDKSIPAIIQKNKLHCYQSLEKDKTYYIIGEFIQ